MMFIAFFVAASLMAANGSSNECEDYTLVTNSRVGKCCMVWEDMNNSGKQDRKGHGGSGHGGPRGSLAHTLCPYAPTQCPYVVGNKDTAHWNISSNIDLGLSRGNSGSQAAKHLMGLAAANLPGGPGRR